MADRIEPIRLLAVGCSTTLVALLAVPLTIQHPYLIWLVMLTMGASLGSFYVVAMTMMGRRYRGAELIGVNTSFVFIWGLGSALGPGLSGSAMTAFGPDGMPAVGAVLCAAFLAIQVVAGAQWLPVVAARWADGSDVARFALTSFYVLIGLHALHVIGGLIPMSVVVVRAFRRGYGPDDHAGVWYCGAYWHFLDVTWVCLFLMLVTW